MGRKQVATVSEGASLSEIGVAALSGRDLAAVSGRGVAAGSEGV